MREIIFRGQRKDNKEWVEGFYVCIGGKYHFICTGKLDITKGFPKFEEHEVLPETVGQFTGLKDKNGKRIFEGDIIRVDDTENGIIEYDETSAFYMVVFDQATSDYGSLIKQYPNVEVIGNIHSNPELLK